MNFAAMGSLRNNLDSIARMKMERQANLLLCIASDLQIIHSQGLIHQDLHNGNILQNTLYSAYIADLGLSIKTNVETKIGSGEICRGLSYIAPEIFDENPYTMSI